jgi:hypothetical protein
VYLVETQGKPNIQAIQEIHRRRQRVQIARVLQITEKMLEQAQQADWQGVEELEELRKCELEASYDLQQEYPSLLVAEALATLLYLNDKIVELAKAARQEVLDSHNKMSRAQNVIDIYQGSSL